MRRLALAVLAILSPASAAAPPAPKVAIVAHRGLEAGVPENTLAAFRYAVARGVPVIEIDLRVTRDAQLVVIHDETVDRTTNGRGRVAGLKLAEIKKLDAGSKVDPRFAGEQVPTFAEALAFIRSTRSRLLVDLKPGTPLQPALDLISEQDMEAKVILGLRRTKDVERAREAAPAITTLSFIDTPADAAAHAAAGAHIIRLWSDWVEADPALIGRVRASGPQAWVMVGRRLPDKNPGWRALHSRMIAAGASGIITDRPELVAPAP